MFISYAELLLSKFPTLLVRWDGPQLKQLYGTGSTSLRRFLATPAGLTAESHEALK